MNRSRISLIHPSPQLTRRRLLTLWGTLSCVLIARPGQSNDRPDEPTRDRVLVEWSTSFPRTAERQTRLKVYASGIVESWPAGNGLCQRERRTPEEVSRLVAEINSLLKDSDLSTADVVSELREESRRTGLSFTIHEADDSIIQVHGESGPQEIRCHAPLLLAERFPEARKLQAFVRLERQLCNLNCVVQCGGSAAAEKLCARVNERLQAEHPGAAPLTTGDLMMVRTSTDGGRFVQFRREEQGSEFWTACVTESPGHAARITVIPPASVLR